MAKLKTLEIAMTKKSQTEMNWNEEEICEANISPGYYLR